MPNFSYQVFATVANQKTFAAAAKSLRVTPSAISHSINAFEKELGFPLFLRNRTGVRLTENGKQILPLVQEIIAAETKLNEEAAQLSGLNKGHVRIGGFSSVFINWLPEIINSFKDAHPQVGISVQQGSFNDVVEQVRLGNLDVGFATLPIDPGLEVLPLYRDRIYCVTPLDFKPQNGHTITKDDIKHEEFILQQIDYDRETKKALDTYDVSVNSIQYSIDDASIIAMVESGLGLGILPELALEKLSGDVKRYPFAQDFYREICLVAHPKPRQTPSTKAFIQTVQAYIQKRY